MQTQKTHRNFLFHTSEHFDNVYLSISYATEDRLGGKCFRGRDVCRAGNFSLWDSFDEFRGDDVCRTLEKDILESIDACDVIPEGWIAKRLEIEHDLNVGWSSTDDISSYEDGELESFVINSKVSGMRILVDCGKFAPQTTVLTIVYSIRYFPNDKTWIAEVFSMYPGEDIGPLEKSDEITDISVREGIVFFDWNHPGQEE